MEQEQLTERISREKDWHNQTAEKGLRRTQEEKYYSVVDMMWNDYMKCIKKELSKESTEFLDYGCGSGDNLIEFSDKIKRGIGIDISESLIDKAKLRVKKESIKNLEFFVMDAMNTTFENETFSLVRGFAILHHLDLEASLNEIKRLLKKDGKAIFFEPLGTNPIIALYSWSI